MEVTLIIKANEKQIILTPENHNEKRLFGLFTPLNAETEKCRGNWLREKNNIILYLEDKEPAPI